MADVLCERDGHLATTTMTRPDRDNAISAEMLSDLGAMLEECGADRSARAIVLTGTRDPTYQGR